LKFEHREPDDSVNVSPLNPAREALVLVGGLGLLFVVTAALLTLLADRLAVYLPVEVEETLFDFVGSEMVDGSDEPDPYLTDLVRRLAEGWTDNPYSFDVWLMDAELPNALALPGGTILVTRPLLSEIHSENALALVLGHELGHFRNRDHLRGLSRQVTLQLLIAGLTGQGMGAGWLFEHLGEVTASGFNRAQESACDTFGLMLTDALYGHVNGATEFFEILVEKEPAAFLNYLRTHPVSKSRVHRMEAEADLLGYAREGDLTPLLPF